MTQAAALLAILLAEAALGYPRRWWHPVMAVGALIGWHERRFNRGGAARRRAAGVLLLGMLGGGAFLLGWAVHSIGRYPEAGQNSYAAPANAGVQSGDAGNEGRHSVTHAFPTGPGRSPGWPAGIGMVVVVLAGTTCLAQRSLYDHVAAVLRPLSAGDLPAARGAVAMIVGRDSAALDEGGVATAAIESLAESFCDGVVAPAFWFLLLGLPGLFAAKAINTADSIVGHRTAALADYGRASARADDGVNWLPARISGVLLCLAGRGGWRTMWRDARAHASPNGGWPEAAMAGALGRRLGGAVSYDGEPARRAVLGDGPVPDARDLRRALRVYLVACVLLWVLVGAIAWLR